MIETRTEILLYAQSQESFRFKDIFSYLNGLFEISKVTLSWYLNEMVKDSKLFKLGRGIYTSHSISTTEYIPILDKKIIKVARAISSMYPFTHVSVFNGSMLANFQQHLSVNNIHYIEVSRDSMEAVFHYLKKKGFTSYLNPDKTFVYNNIDLSKEAFIVKPLITESPLINVKGVNTPKLEKILVDILCDDDMDYLHGEEWNYIFDNAITMYSINITSMLRYASRRNAKAFIEKAIKNVRKNYD